MAKRYIVTIHPAADLSPRFILMERQKEQMILQ